MEHKTESGKNYYEIAMSYLPLQLSAAVRKTAGNSADEIRLTRGAECAVSVNGKRVRTEITCSDDDLKFVLRRISGNSLYAHGDSIADGYIISPDGLRVGVAGRAVIDGGKIASVTDISSLVIRIPSRKPGAADTLYKLMRDSFFKENVLIYSPPSGGKTTALRELVALLATDENLLRIAVVDTRCEICEGLGGLPVSVLSSYPRNIGIEIAVRTMSPDIVVCDEVYGKADFGSLEAAAGSGVTSVVTLHASSLKDALSRLEYAGCKVPFGIFYGVNKFGEPDVRKSVDGAAAS